MLNQCNFIGNLTRDWDTRQTQGGTSVANGAIAVNQKYKDRDETLFVNLVLWGKTAEVAAQYTGKGSKVFITGRLVIRSYEDREGQKRWITEVHADKVVFLDSKKDRQQQDQQNSGGQPPWDSEEGAEISEDDVHI